MGQYTSEVLGVVGAVVGFYAGSPQIGYAIGSAIGGVIEGPTTIPAPGLGEAPVQTSRDGVPIPIVWGLHQVHGNILQKNPETQVTTTESQGKGGGVETENTRRFRTFAIGVCRGPIYDITRIWENGRLVYDRRSSPAIPEEETDKYAEGIRVYYGTEDQLPDPDLEAHWGEDNTPHYKGLAYIVWVNKDLTDIGGAIPSFAFEVNGSRDATVTSKPYPVEQIEGFIATPVWQKQQVWAPPIEGFDVVVTLEAIELGTLLESYSMEEEGFETTVTLSDITLEVALEEYDMEEEGFDVTVTLDSITLATKLVPYTYEPEGFSHTVTIQNINLSG